MRFDDLGRIMVDDDAGAETVSAGRDLWPYVRPRPLPAICTIYFVGPADGPIKIGMASRVQARVNDLRLANAYQLEIWATVEGPPSAERAYHKRFAAHRLHGEWFQRCPEILAEIDRLRALVSM